MKRWNRRGLRLLIGLVSLAVVVGCGGSLSLTGGSVPIGTSRLKGIVVRADNVLQPVADATLALTLLTDKSQRATPNASKITTDLQGRFDFGPITGGRFSCAIQPLSLTGLDLNWNWFFELPEGTSAQMIAALWPDWFDPHTVRRVTLAPDVLRLRVGDTVRLIATAYDEDDRAIPLGVSLMVEGDIGTLQIGGLFHAEKAGRGKVRAWMPNYEVSAEIQVDP